MRAALESRFIRTTPVSSASPQEVFMEMAPTVLKEALFTDAKPSQDMPSQMSMSQRNGQV